MADELDVRPAGTQPDIVKDPSDFPQRDDDWTLPQPKPGDWERIEAAIDAGTFLEAPVGVVSPRPEQDEVIVRVMLARGIFGVIPDREFLSDDDRRDLDSFEARLRRLETYRGRYQWVQPIKADREHNQVACSRIAARETLAKKQWDQIEQSTNGQLQDQIWEGTIEYVRDDGAFVDLGGLTGFLPVAQISTAYIDRATDVLDQGDVIRVAIENYNRERGRVILSSRKVVDSRWRQVMAPFKPDDRMRAKVLGVSRTGVALRLEIGVTAGAQLPDGPRPQEGDTVWYQIKRIDPQKREVWGYIRRREVAPR